MSAGLARRRLSELKGWAKNPKLHSLEKLVALFKSYGFTNPILLNEATEEIISGHGRYFALRAMQRAGEEPPERIGVDPDGEWLVPVVTGISMSREKGWAYALDDNLSTMAGGGYDFEDMARAFDREGLADVLGELAAGEAFPVILDLEDREAVLRRLRWAGREGEGDEFDVEAALNEVIEPRIRPGEVWALGQHRLACGDATNPADVHRLLDGERVLAMMADPPYGINLDLAWRQAAVRARPKLLRARRIEGDDRADWGEAWAIWKPQVIYVFHAANRAHLVRQSLIDAGYEVRQQLIWYKGAVLSRAAYHWAHEPLWYAVRQGQNANWKGDRAQTTVWEHRSPLAGSGLGTLQDEATPHPTQKPVALYEIAIRNHTDVGGIVADPFAGSGTMAIAAERLGRRALLMEISPRWCELAMRRWEGYTGQRCEIVYA